MKITGTTAAQIFDSVRGLAQSGQLRPGQALPPVRELAGMLSVNRNTVASAYKRLVTAGIALTQGRLGTVIRARPGPGEQEGSASGTPLVDLASGNPNPAYLPDLADVLARKGYRPRLYGEDPVNPALEAHARQWFEGDCPASLEINLTHGAVDAIERLLAAHLASGDKVAVESPCFLSSINTLRHANLQAIGVAVDAAGMRADALDAALALGAQAVLITPRAHNPTGCSLTLARARALRQVLERYPHVLIIVDDHFAMLSDVAYHPVIPVTARRWALLRSMSKGLGPDLRLAFVASDEETSRRLRLRLASGTTWVSHVLQDIAEACLESDVVQSQLAQAKASYGQRRNGLMQALEQQGIPGLAPMDGLNVWVPLEHDSQPVVLGLAQRGWLVRGGQGFGVHEMVHGLRITVSTLEQAQADRLAADLRHSLILAC